MLALTAVTLLAVMRVGLVRELDRRLTNETELLVALTQRRAAPELARRPDLIVQVIDANGTVLSASAGADPERSLIGIPDATRAGTRTSSVDDPELGEMRVQTTPIGGQGRWLVVARSEAQLQQSVRVVRWSLLVLVPVITGGLGLVVWTGVGRALRPIDTMRTSVGEITERNLALRVTEPGTGDEVDRLAVTMNGMLDRLEAASHHERQLVADASHELRSPVAAVRALVETRPLAGEELEAHDAATIAAIVRLQSLVEQLLELASQDATAPGAARAVDLDDVVLAQARILALARDLTVDTSAVSAGQVLGRAESLHHLVENLSSNAARHARSRVTFTVTEAGGTVTLTAADDGPGVPEADRQRIFERFTRLDDARTADGAGAGLGLAIASGIATRHGGTIAVDDDPVLGGARFTVRLPSTTPGG